MLLSALIACMWASRVAMVPQLTPRQNDLVSRVNSRIMNTTSPKERLVYFGEDTRPFFGSLRTSKLRFTKWIPTFPEQWMNETLMAGSISQRLQRDEFARHYFGPVVKYRFNMPHLIVIVAHSHRGADVDSLGTLLWNVCPHCLSRLINIVTADEQRDGWIEPPKTLRSMQIALLDHELAYSVFKFKSSRNGMATQKDWS